MNLSQIREAVRDDLYEPTAAFWSNAELVRRINRAYREVRTRIAQLDEELFEREITVVYPGSSRQESLAGLGFTSEPLKFILVEDVTGNANRPVNLDHIEKISEGAYRTKGGVVADSTAIRGSSYYLSAGPGGGREIGVRPIPAQALTLRITYVPQTVELVQDPDTPDIPDDFHECIVLGAVYSARMKEEAPVRDIRERYESVLDNALKALDGRHSDRHLRVGVAEPEMYDYDA